jgi:beta-glucosidase
LDRIDALIAQMTLAEKLGQLTMTAAGYAVTGPVIAGDSTESIKSGAIGNLLNLVGAGPVRDMQRLAVEESRLGIPLLMGFDVIHGHRTAFPVPLGEAAAFDPELWAQTAREAAREAAADGIAMTFAPMLDVARDPRWGRSVEGPGEDPWLGALVARAKVRGFQGDDLAAADALAAVAKHYVAYGPVTAGREYASVDISERTLREVHMPPFAAAVAAGVAAVMPAFTDLAGVPMTAHVALLRDWLRGRLGFDGVIISDYNAIGELRSHGIAADLAEAAALALTAGVDIDMMADAYRYGLPQALERGWVSVVQIDQAVRRVLNLKERLGLFDDPYRRGAATEEASVLRQRRRLARTAAVRSLVLLKNEAALPLVGLTRLAVIGPLADAAAEMRGPWCAAAEPEAPVSVLQGLRASLPSAQIRHATGLDPGDGAAGIAAALEACTDAEAIVLCLGERANMSGEAASRAHLGLPGRQDVLAEAVFDRAVTSRTPVIVIVFSGRPLILTAVAERAAAVIAAWFPGNEAGNALADVLTGAVSPSGRSPVTWPRAAGQVPVFFGQRPGGRPANPNDPFTSKYLDVSNEPLYPFGHGLTYGHFVLSELEVWPLRVRETDTINVRIRAVNDGVQVATETIFLFTRDKLATVARPVLELKGFGKLNLLPGQSGVLTLGFSASELRFLGPDLEPIFESGEVDILVGPCADRSRLLTVTIQADAGSIGET